MSTSDLFSGTPTATTSAASTTSTAAATLAPTPSSTAATTIDVTPTTQATEDTPSVGPNASENPIQSDATAPASNSTAPLSTVECTDNPEPEFSCDQRKEYCDQEWMIEGDFCNRTCGRCSGDDTGSNGSDHGNGGQPTTDNGNDNPYAPLNGQGTRGVTTRYWDCCKPSCGWSGKGGRIIDSCNLNDDNIGANDQNRSVCDGGDAQTCHSMSPTKHSNALAYGYAAINGATCGSCYQIEFTGTANNGQQGDEGSARLKGKTMVVMATNIGDIGANHFDLLIPGGGLGVMTQGCPKALGLSAEQLGATRGGFRTTCAGSGSQDAVKACVTNKCKEVFGGKGLTELEAGCLWYADWFEAADNPDMVYKELPECPAELSGFF